MISLQVECFNEAFCMLFDDDIADGEWQFYARRDDLCFVIEVKDVSRLICLARRIFAHSNALFIAVVLNVNDSFVCCCHS